MVVILLLLSLKVTVGGVGRLDKRIRVAEGDSKRIRTKLARQ